MVAIPMLMMLRDVIKALAKLLVVIFLVAILNFKNGRHLDFKMAAIFNICWTISQLLSYLQSSVKIVAIPMFVMLRIATNALGKLLVVLSAAILNFKMAVIQIPKWPPFSTYFGLYLYF